jgi:predicted nucleotidyltransferase
MTSKDEIKEKILFLSGTLHKYHVSRLGLFGSAVHNRDSEKSDIDLLVDFDETIDLFAYSDLVEILSATINRDVDLVTVAGLRPELKDKIMSEVEWIEGI